MKRLQRMIAVIFLCLLVLCLTACGAYTPPDRDPSGGEVIPGEPTKPSPPPEPEKKETFSVSLVLNADAFTGEQYENITQLQAQWTDKDTGEVYRASFNEDGKAEREGLDGDYKVTLVSLPNGYTYEPNGYEATNDFKNITMRLYPLTATRGTGADAYATIITLESIGAYRVTLNSPSQKIWFRFYPRASGVYSIQSMADTTANLVNPILDRYNGTSSWVSERPIETMDGGGASNTFTKNFRWEMSLGASYIGNVFPFMIRSECLNADAYPVDIDFILDKDGDFTEGGGALPMVTVREDFDKTPATPAGSFTYCVRRGGPNRILNEKAVALHEDGYYYYYDSVTETLGERLYAKLTQPCEVIDEPFATGPHIGLYSVNGYNYTNFIAAYAGHCNGDGCYPVNEELKLFLQNYSVSQRYFNDGDGYAEVYFGYNSDEASQWMFACGFYQ